LFTIDTGTAVCSVIGDVGDGLDLSAMAFDSSGDLWMVDSFGPRLIQIDKFTAAILDSKPLGPINQEIGGLAFRPSDGTLFHAAGLASMLYTIDTGTGTPSVIGPISVPGGIWGLTFTQDPVPTIDTTWGKVKASFRRP
ncbi:MAG: hypothetical protein KC729_17950, partial [Candidatus Eisenbacteria bacterium]|nr:hypothetical protein [Candidatus Eisenbacteria bacterium]